MRPDTDASGEIRITYEMHSFRDQAWYRLNTWSYRAEAMAAVEQLCADQTVDGVRLVRVDEYVDFGFFDNVIVFKRMISDISEVDPLAPAIEPGLPFCWRQVSDYFQDRGRDELRAQLSRYLEDKRITTLELVHSEKHSIDLDNAGTVLQGVFQKIAVSLAQSGKASAASLFKDMMALWSQLVLQLRNDANANKVMRLEPGRFVEVAAQLDKQFGVEAGSYHLNRAIGAYLLDAKTWLEKLDRLGQLYEVELERRHIRILDAQTADIFSAAGPYRELLEDGCDRVSAMCTVGSLYGGTFKPASGTLPRGVATLNSLISDGRMPRTRSALRKRVLREVLSRQPLLPGRTLMQELEALNSIVHHFVANAHSLVKDEEVTDAIVNRATRSMTLQGVSECIGSAQKVTEKLAVLSRLASLAPGPVNKAAVFRYFRAAMPPDDLVRICLREASNRLAAVATLAEVQRMLVAAPIDDLTRTEALNAVDVVLLDIFKTDILLAPNRSYADRMVLLFKVCSSIKLGEGKARALVVETIGREFRNPKFLPQFKQRFKSEAEARDILIKVKGFLAGEKNAGA
ncbi:MAG: hypothetical protein WCK65_09310 [Rhodospirillaceae bacterium]